MNLPALLSRFKESFGNISTLVTTVLTIAGGIYAYQSYNAGLPNLIIEADSLNLQAPVKPIEIHTQLVNIENKYGRVTADKINEMKKLSEELSYYDHDKIEKLLTQVYANIDVFQRTINPWNAQQIQYLYAGKIQWPDGTVFDIMQDPKAEKLFPVDYLEVRTNPTTISTAVQNRLKEKAFSLYKPFGENQEFRLEVADQLRVVRSQLEALKNFNNYSVEVNLTIINKSTTPNFLTSLHKLKMKNAKGAVVLALRVTQSELRKVEAKGIIRLKAQSKIFSQSEAMSSSSNSNLLINLFKTGCTYEVLLTDIDQNPWLFKTTLAKSN